SGDPATPAIRASIDEALRSGAHVGRILDAQRSAPASIDSDRWLQTFAPVELPDGSAVVLQLTTDFAPTEAAIDSAQALAAVTLAGGGVALFAGLLPLLLRARRRAVEQTERLGVLLKQEQHTVAELQTLDTMKNTFLSAVSHELRTPLTIVLGNAVTLQRHSSSIADERLRPLVDGLVNQAIRLDGLLSDLLDVDRLSQGVMEPRRRPTDLAELVRRVAETVDLEGHPLELPVRRVDAEVDPAWFERVVQNLIRNAVKHTPAGTRVRVELERLDDGVSLIVEDDGQGIAHADRDRVFQLFTQLDHDNPSPGTGVGLSLVERFVALHGGKVQLTESAAGGCRFEIRLPTGDLGGALAHAEHQDAGTDPLALAAHA
ncbi:MAG TPA: ATP-binding protein, partial [Nitriliruptorales bacterium]